MNKLLVFALAAVMLSACNTEKQDAETDQQEMPAAEQSAPQKRDVSTATLVKIDPAIQEYADRVQREKEAYDAEPNDENKAELIAAYVSFGDYMTYESPVSPREGKYHRALLEYRHALELDPENSKAMAEAEQIEAIYHSMNRPVPGEE